MSKNKDKDNIDMTQNEEIEINENAESKKDEYIAKLNDDLVEQKKKADEYFEHLKRNMADFDNFKKRITKEKDIMHDVVTSDVLVAILPVIDNFESAIVTECSDTSFKNGMEMIYTQLKEAVKKLGIEEIKSLGETFDPNLHEAVMHIEDSNYSDKEVIEVFRKGYKVGDKVIRHSMVKVAN